MDNEKLKNYGILFLAYGWIPAMVISEALSISFLFSGLWALTVIVVYLSALITDQFSTVKSHKKWEKLNKDFFDRDVDYLFFKLKIDKKETSDFNLEKLNKIKGKYKDLLLEAGKRNFDQDIVEKSKKFKEENGLSLEDLTDLKAIVSLEAIEIISSEVLKLQLDKIILDSNSSEGNDLVYRLSQIIENELDVYHALFAIAFARNDSQLRKKFSRGTRGNLAKIIFEKFDSVEKFEALAKSFASEYPNYNRYNL